MSSYQKLAELVRQKYPTYADAWARARNEFGPDWELEFSNAIDRLFGTNEQKWRPAVDGYAEFCTDALRSQIFFEKNGRYKATSYADVAATYYHNADFMFQAYLPGMFLSHYVWPHHHRMLRWFRELCAGIEVSTFSDVGTGCGVYSMEPLQLFGSAEGIGYDISEHALVFTKQVVSAFGLGARYRTEVRDIVANRPHTSDLVICQEVLEHLEDPAGFCKSLFLMTRPGGHAYVTAAINAGHVDHIYLYRSVGEVLEHLTGAGFQIIASRNELAYLNKPLGMTPALGGALVRRPA